MADLAQRVLAIDPAETVGIRVAAVLLILVFAIKAALVPLHFWLPSSYAEAPAPVAALFAIMTKVGAYAIIRVYTMIFPPDLEVTAGLQADWLLAAALVSLALGAMGVLAARKLDRLVTYSVIGSMGMAMVTISLFTPQSTAAALYYIIHSTFAAATLFLIVDMVKGGRADLRLIPMPSIGGAVLVSALFFSSRNCNGRASTFVRFPRQTSNSASGFPDRSRCLGICCCACGQPRKCGRLFSGRQRPVLESEIR